MQFDWKSEEDDSWDAGPQRQPQAPRRRRWPFLLFALLLLAAFGFFTWQQLDRQVSAELSALEADVRSSHALAVQAAGRKDQELFTSLLSGRNSEWTAVQQTLLDEGLLFAQAGRALGLQPLPEASTVTAVEFSPDLREALLTVRHSYAGGDDGAGQAVTLQQTLSYRMGARGWLLSPPDESFWGPWQTQEGRHVTLRFREREAQAAARLLSFLDETLSGACQAWQSPCPPASALRVRLEPAAQSLVGAQEMPLSAGEVTLPALSLVGLPVDVEDGRGPAERALFRGYAAAVVAAVNAELLDFDCCRQRLYFEALQRQQLHELGLGEQPLAPEDYVPFVDGIIPLPRLNELWWWPQREPPNDLEKRQIDAFVAFLLQETPAGVRHLQKGVTEAYGFWAWLREYTPYDPAIEQAELTSAWHNFIMARANEARAGGVEPPAPQQVLWLTCQDDNGQRGLYRYDAQGEQMLAETGLVSRFESLIPAPGDDGVVLFDNVSGYASRLPARLHNGEGEIPLRGELAPARSLPRDPQGRYLTMWRISQSGRTIDSIGLLDTAQCQAGRNCPDRTAPGLPYWSPGGERVLFLDTNDGELFLGDREALAAEESVARDVSGPFWLDEQTYGYVADDGRRLYLAERGGEAQEMLSMAEVLPVLDVRGQNRDWRFASILPVGTDGLVGAVTLPASSAHHFFLVEGLRSPQRRLENLLYVPHMVVSAPESTVSADGRWLALYLSEAELQIRFVLHDLGQNRTTLDVQSTYFNAYHAHDWSADGRWLARLGNGYVELLALPPDQNSSLYRHFVPTRGMQCSSLAWVND